MIPFKLAKIIEDKANTPIKARFVRCRHETKYTQKLEPCKLCEIDSVWVEYGKADMEDLFCGLFNVGETNYQSRNNRDA